MALSSVSMLCDSVGSLHRGRGGKDTSSSRHPEFSRSMSSDNWRDTKKRDADTDASGSWRSRQDHARPGTLLTSYGSREARGAVARTTPDQVRY